MGREDSGATGWKERGEIGTMTMTLVWNLEMFVRYPSGHAKLAVGYESTVPAKRTTDRKN